VECIVNHLDETTQDERALRDVIDQSMTGVVGPAERIRENARNQGRLLRTRRRAGTALGLAAIAGVAAFSLPQLVGGSTAGADGSPPYAVQPSATQSVPASPGDAEGWWDVPAPEMLDRLETLLPADTHVVASQVMNEDRAPGEAYGPMHGYLLADLISVASHGPGGLNLMLSAPGGPAATQRISCPGNLVHPDQCTELRDADGRHYGRTSVWTSQGVTILEVVVKVAYGGLVYLATSNSSDDKWGAGSTVTADETPLSMAELRAIVEDPTWTAWTPGRGPHSLGSGSRSRRGQGVRRLLARLTRFGHLGRIGQGTDVAAELAGATVEVVADEARLDLERGHLDAGRVGPHLSVELAVDDDRVASVKRPLTVLGEGSPGVDGVPLGSAVDPRVGLLLVAPRGGRDAEVGHDRVAGLPGRDVTAQPALQSHKSLVHRCCSLSDLDQLIRDQPRKAHRQRPPDPQRLWKGAVRIPAVDSLWPT
jgi:hypothetical protein